MKNRNLFFFISIDKRLGVIDSTAVRVFIRTASSRPLIQHHTHSALPISQFEIVQFSFEMRGILKKRNEIMWENTSMSSHHRGICCDMLCCNSMQCDEMWCCPLITHLSFFPHQPNTTQFRRWRVWNLVGITDDRKKGRIWVMIMKWKIWNYANVSFCENRLFIKNLL